MKIKIIGILICVFLFLSNVSLTTVAITKIGIKDKVLLKNTFTSGGYVGNIFIEGRYDSVDRYFGPLPILLEIKCQKGDITIWGTYNVWDRYGGVHGFPFMESDFDRLSVIYLIGFCRFGYIRGFTTHISFS